MAENQVQQPFEAFKAELEKRGNATEIKGRLRTDRIFNHLLTTATITEELLDKAAFDALVELERRREAGIPVNRFDAGGVEGGDLEGQEGGEPDAVAPAGHVHGPDCDHDHDPEAEEAKPKKRTTKKTEDASEEKPKKIAKAEPEAEEKPKAKKVATAKK
jgi:trigger factor